MQYHFSQVVYILCTSTVYMIQCLEFLKWFAQGSNFFVWCKREMVLPIDNELLMNHKKKALIIWSEINSEIVINIIFYSSLTNTLQNNCYQTQNDSNQQNDIQTTNIYQTHSSWTSGLKNIKKSSIRNSINYKNYLLRLNMMLHYFHATIY